MRIRGTSKKALAMTAAIFVALAATGGLVSKAWAGAPTVKTAEVSRETLSIGVTVSGKTEADRKADVFPPAAGTLASVRIVEGQRVRKGQVLAVMESDRLDAQVERAEAAYEQADAQVDALDSQGPSSEQLDTASEQMALAYRAYQRADRAHRDQAHAAYLQAKAGKQQLEGAGPTGSQLDAARAGRDQAATELRLAKADRADAVLRAPIAGTVVFNAAGMPGSDGSLSRPGVGSSVSPQAAPFSVVRMDALRFSAEADEGDVARIQVGDKATVTLEAFPGHGFSTRVSAIQPAAVPTKNGGSAFPVLLSLSGSKKPLRIGMNGSVDIAVEAVADAVVIPMEALLEDTNGTYAFVVSRGKLARRAVETGAMTDELVQVVDGLAPGETVALAEDGKLKEGMKVRPETPEQRRGGRTR